MDDLITIVIPVYNVEKYLNRCISSVIKQTYDNLEIILSDDGSKDSSGSICDDFAKKDKRIKVLHFENKGLSEARNRGIRIAKGKYICFVDSDDWVDENYVLKMYYALRKTNSDIAECRYKRCSNETEIGNKNGNILEFDNTSALSLLCNVDYDKHIVAWNKLYKTELFNDVLFPAGKLHEDEFTVHKLISKVNKFCIVNDELYFYFQNQASIMTSKISLRRLDSIDAFLERIEFFKSKNLSNLANKTSHLLFRLFCDFASFEREKFADFDKFFFELNKKYIDCKSVIDTQQLNKVEKRYLKKATKNVLNLKKCKISVYYSQRIKSKIRSIKSKFSIAKKPSFIAEIKKSRKTNSRIGFILSAVEYLNYGDLAIGEAIKQYTSNYFKVIEISQNDTVKYFDKLKKMINYDDIIFLPGGGNMGDVWKYDENIRRNIIKSFPNNKIVIFPQSINYCDLESEYFLQSVKIYNNNPFLTLCVRDVESLNKARSYYNNLNCVLIPDSVFLLNDVVNPESASKVALCFRDDKEQSASSIRKELEIIDVIEDLKMPIELISTVSNGNTSLLKRKDDVMAKIKEVASYKIVVTDRLHCIIFCALTGTPCIALNNANNKIKMFIETWLPNAKFVLYLDKNDKIDASIFNHFIDYKYKEKINLADKFNELGKILDEYSKI